MAWRSRVIFRLVAGLEHGKTCHAALFEIAGLGQEAVALAWKTGRM